MSGYVWYLGAVYYGLWLFVCAVRFMTLEVIYGVIIDELFRQLRMFICLKINALK